MGSLGASLGTADNKSDPHAKNVLAAIFLFCSWFPFLSPVPNLSVTIRKLLHRCLSTELTVWLSAARVGVELRVVRVS